MSDASFSLKNKVVLQFGGSGLLGRAMVDGIAKAGATLVVASRDANVIAADAERLRTSGCRIQLENVDLLDEASIHQLLARIAKAHGRLDGMVYNAVNRPMSGGFDDDLSKWEESMKLNATGFFAAVRACGNVMAKQGSGSIVNISSQMGSLGFNPYALRRHGDENLARLLFPQGRNEQSHPLSRLLLRSTEGARECGFPRRHLQPWPPAGKGVSRAL